MDHPLIGSRDLRLNFDAREIAGRRGVELRIFALVGFPEKKFSTEVRKVVKLHYILRGQWKKRAIAGERGHLSGRGFDFDSLIPFVDGIRAQVRPGAAR